METGYGLVVWLIFFAAVTIALLAVLARAMGAV